VELVGRNSPASTIYIGLPAAACNSMLLVMFIVSEEAAATIRTAYEQGGELSAAIEVRRLVPGDHRQRQGAGMRSDHRRVAAAACRGLSNHPVTPS
jgi:hypothetical protein